MRISSIPQIYRHGYRSTEIFTVLSRYGLADWLGRVGLGPKSTGGATIAHSPWETRVRMALAELGPTFIKLGQVLSTRPDLVGVRLADELKHLQADVPGDSAEQVRKTIELELGRPVSDLFAEFDGEPMASASIGQVHRARLKTGEAVVVKVQHADIQRKIEVDLDILGGLAMLAEMNADLQNYRPRAIAAEFHRTLMRELDFGREQRQMLQFSRDFSGNPCVHIPRPYPELSTSRVLTMELIEGIKLEEHERLAEEGFDLSELARTGARLYLDMIFGNGFYHADPHPGNVLIMDGNVIGLLDFGMVGRIDERLQEDIEEALIALSNQDAEHLAAVIVRVGKVPPELDRVALALDLTDFISHYTTQQVDDFDVGGALREMVELIRRYRIRLPARIAMLIKVLITLEGTAQLLNPQFNLLEIMQPYRKKMLLRRYSPKRHLRRLQRFYSDLEQLLRILPQGIVDILEQVQSGAFDVHLDHRGLEPSVNRLVLGMLASALFLGSSLLLSNKVPPQVGDVSLLGVTGCLAAIFLGLRLWRAINKSGRLDRR
ncbi:MAG: AarF/ABC1/UbiB kinase family protein [Rhodopirellula sp.]|nr:AarF/ABC1/UbiB kinase family protein [Rhodopirellula sp.]